VPTTSDTQLSIFQSPKTYRLFVPLNSIQSSGPHYETAEELKTLLNHLLSTLKPSTSSGSGQLPEKADCSPTILWSTAVSALTLSPAFLNSPAFSLSPVGKHSPTPTPSCGFVPQLGLILNHQSSLQLFSHSTSPSPTLKPP
jgi:hypothetical protein